MAGCNWVSNQIFKLIGASEIMVLFQSFHTGDLHSQPLKKPLVLFSCVKVGNRTQKRSFSCSNYG